ACAADNDLFRVASENGLDPKRFDSPQAAVEAAGEGDGVLLLASGYPAKTTALDAALFEKAAQKKLRVYVEYPAFLPGLKVGSSRRISMERVVVASDAFGASLRKMQILAVHDCHFVPVLVDHPHLAVAKVAGFDRAIYGLEGTPASAILFEYQRGLLVAATKLSQFVTARYATQEAMQAIWGFVFRWLEGESAPARRLEWTPAVRPTYSREQVLPPDAVRQAVQRGIDWHTKARMLLSEEGWKEYQERRATRKIDPNNPVGSMPLAAAGDGRFGVLEGVASQIRYDGSQAARWWLRSDCNGESSLAFALHGKMDGDGRSRSVASNLLDWVYVRSGLFQNDPAKANYGLLFWAPDNAQALYQDNDVKAILGCLGTAGALGTDRWDEALVKNILGNFRTTGRYGFRGWRLENPDLLRDGWQNYWLRSTILFQPHYEAWTWATYLWLYDKTHWAPLLEKPRYAIRKTMQAYPKNWRWTNGIQQERGRMLLALAWLIRVDDRPEHRAWLRQMADDLERCQDPSGAIREELGPPGHGDMAPPASNAAYGSNEAPLIQENGDPVADLLYTCNFAFLGLNEAFAATGDAQYRRMADRLAEFLIRIQVRSELHPELDGGWFRAFDYRQWEYWGSNADSGWGAWAIEAGWTQAWIPTVLALRQMKTSLWELSASSQVARHFARLRPEMIPDSALSPASTARLRHDALEKKATLLTSVSEAYPGDGAASLTDGLLGSTNCTDSAWLGFHENDLAARIDLGQPTPIKELGASFLQNVSLGIYLPTKVEFLAGDNPAALRPVGTTTSPSGGQAGPFKQSLRLEGLDLRARYLEVRASNTRVIPAGHPAAGQKAWLFVDEVMVNPAAVRP
ncbi:MAG: hypothetical protein WCQ21_22780, partial [Verrucomicrobiota bacterium]